MPSETTGAILFAQKSPNLQGCVIKNICKTFMEMYIHDTLISNYNIVQYVAVLKAKQINKIQMLEMLRSKV